jgi:hypothetical protein
MNTTHLTDFISPEVLAREGFVHTSDSAQMLEKIDKTYLAQCGYVNLSALRDVKLSVRKAAEVAGVSASTLKEYVKLGYLQVGADGYVSLIDAITFDYAAAKRKYLDSKSR